MDLRVDGDCFCHGCRTSSYRIRFGHFYVTGADDTAGEVPGNRDTVIMGQACQHYVPVAAGPGIEVTANIGSGVYDGLALVYYGVS